MKEIEFLYIFTTPKKWKLFSWIIKWRLKTKYSHVAIAIYIPPTKEYRIYQASSGDVNCIDFRNFLKHNKVIMSAEEFVSRDKFIDGMRFLDKQTGKKYGLLGAIASTFSFLRKIGLGNDGDKTFICSEYAYRLRQIYKSDMPNVDSDYVEPKIFESHLRECCDLKDGLQISRDWLIPKN